MCHQQWLREVPSQLPGQKDMPVTGAGGLFPSRYLAWWKEISPHTFWPQELQLQPSTGQGPACFGGGRVGLVSCCPGSNHWQQ